MLIEPIIAFFILWDIRKILKGTPAAIDWERKLKGAMFFVGALFTH
jgi:hypothetical protein